MPAGTVPPGTDRAAATAARSRSTIRGPHREATSSFKTITRWSRTADMADQPGRARTEAIELPSARKTKVGLARITASEESWG